MANLTHQQTLFYQKYIECKGNASEAAKESKFKLKEYRKGVKGYYVYALLDPLLNDIFYIGKGIRERCLDHEREYKRGTISNNNKHKRLKQILDFDERPKIVVLQSNLEEDDAFKIERLFIHAIGKERLTNAMSGQYNDKERAQLMAQSFLDKKLAPVGEWLNYVSEKKRAIYWEVRNELLLAANGDWKTLMEVNNANR